MQKEHEGIYHGDTLSWEAESFYYHPKDFSWYLLAILASIPIALIPWIISGRADYTTPVIIFVALFGLTIYAGRKPEKRHFELSHSRLKVDSQSFELLNFSRYWVETFETHSEITLVGVKRTAMPITLYLTDKEVLIKVLTSLQTSLPESNPSKNPADWITKKIKF